ncbi:MAG: carboxymuconolactone decarboxylase family protein [Calditrichia bacterium]
MAKSQLESFREERRMLNDLVLNNADLTIKRFFSLDNQTYREGHLSASQKELLGLVASMVLRCDDCITYHIDQCFKEGITKEQFVEAAGVALVVGGSIVIPHLRRAFKTWMTLEEEAHGKQ